MPECQTCLAAICTRRAAGSGNSCVICAMGPRNVMEDGSAASVLLCLASRRRALPMYRSHPVHAPLGAGIVWIESERLVTPAGIQRPYRLLGIAGSPVGLWWVT